MKVLQINNFHYLRGGSDRMYFETANLLTKNGDEVGFFSSVEPENEPTVFQKYFTPGKNLVQSNSISQKIKSSFEFIYNKNAVLNLSKLLADFEPDIIHLHIFQSRLSSGIIKAIKDSGIPSIMTVHEYKILCPVYVFLDGKGQLCEKCANGNYLHGVINKCTQNSYFPSTINSIESFTRDAFFSYTSHIDAFVYPSAFIKNKHIQYKSNLENKSFVVANFLDTELFVPAFKNENYLLYFGRLSKEKGVLTLVECMKYFPNVQLVVVGKGPEEEAVKNIVTQLQLKNVKLVGAKYGSDLISTIQQASFTIVPSEWYETFGLTIIESYACGTPVIASSIGGMTELIKENKTGFLFESRKVESLRLAIQKAFTVFDDKSAYQLMCDQSRKYAEAEFDKVTYYKKLKEVYNWAIDKKNKTK